MSNFIESLKARARADRKRIVLPEGRDPRTITAAEQILREDFADIVVLGNPAKISCSAEVIDPSNSPDAERYAQALYEIRKSKGMTLPEAEELVQNPLYYGVMMVKLGDADGMVAGAVNSTPNVLRPSLQILKTAPGISLVSSFFVMVVPDCEYGENGIFIFSDCGLNANPSSEELSEIAISSAESFKKLVGKTPKVAMLSYSTLASAKGELVSKMQLATKLAKEKAPDLALDGELQLDAAIVPSIGESKAAGSEVSGSANVLIFPNLDAGNIGYKLTQRLAKAEAYGPITQGISRPVNDLSRGCSSEDIVGVVAITCIQA